MTPRVSVVMPVRDVVRFVDEAVSSILEQTLDDLELVIVDDGSTDGTVERIREHARRDARVRVHEQETLGLVSALNIGCALASAELIARMDGDDVARPERLARQVAELERAPEVVLLGSAVTLIDEQGTEFRSVDYPEAPGEELLDRNCFAHPAVVFRKEAFVRAGGYRAGFPHAEDYDLWLRLDEHGTVANLAASLLLYRVHGGQVTRRRLEEQVASTVVAQEVARVRRETGIEPAARAASADQGVIRRRLVAAYVDLGGQRIDLNQLAEAARLLDHAEELVEHTSHAESSALIAQSARLAWRRGQRLQAARLLLAARSRARRVWRQ